LYYRKSYRQKASKPNLPPESEGYDCIYSDERHETIDISKSSRPREESIEAQQDDKSSVLKGESASLGVARGPARIVLGKDDFQRVNPGDILVCHEMNPSWVPLFSVAASLVSDEGGVLSHAAVLVREFGLPGVVGVVDATQRLRDGQIVEVDGDSELVRMVSDKN
jgi:pyruvate,water dikinase